MAACSGDNKSEFRSGIEDGFESAGLDATDEQIDCLTDSIIEKVGGEDRLDELESEFDSADDLPEDVQAEFTTAATESFEECESTRPPRRAADASLVHECHPWHHGCGVVPGPGPLRPSRVVSR